MLKTKEQLKEYLKADMSNYESQNVCFIKRCKNNLTANPVSDQKSIWKYIKTLRYLEYHVNNEGILHKIATLYYSYRLRNLSYKTGFQIPPNTCGKGLTIWHWGTIVINPKARLGDFCTLNPMIIIGHKREGDNAPQIGNNVFIGAGAKIIGDIKIGNNVIIAPNTNIVKNIDNGSVVVGASFTIIK